MKGRAFEKVMRSGEDIVVRSSRCPGGRAARGFVQQLGYSSGDGRVKFTPPGAKDNGKFLLIADPSAIGDNEDCITVEYDGYIYEVIDTEKFLFNGSVSHWQAFIRRTDRSGGDA